DYYCSSYSGSNSFLF
nr:immunoglobulin light chain junction region [Macaca mulatta]MOV96479.1 immunoglobulin light chain junction region [Macaca mulatta]MOV96574.1 immunoglobulin light chain junction region [Macaca mulatta]MOV96895.1 immunoglobulin light chain junction region [Macaca mulatta]MOV97918.1 immunoglobulin light chain junction region [Macaca mulatta]